MVNLMKSLTIPFLIAGLLCSAQGHGAQNEVDAVGKWLNERTMRAALEVVLVPAAGNWKAPIASFRCLSWMHRRRSSNTSVPRWPGTRQG